jgi:hypothetical protein
MTRFILFSLIILSLVCCEGEPIEQLGEVNAQITSANNGAFNNQLVFDRGYVHLTNVEVQGLKDGTMKSAQTGFSEPEQFFFIGEDPRQPVKVPIAEATYDDPSVNLYFYHDPYVLQVRDTVYADYPNGGEPGNPDNGGGNGDGNGNGNGNGDGDGDDDDGDDGDDGDGDDDDNDNDGDDEDDDGDDDDDDDDDGDDDDDDDDDGDDDDGDDEDDDGDDDDDRDDDGDDDDDDGDDDRDDDDDDGRLQATGKTVNLIDFLLNGKPSIVLLGTYQQIGDTIQVIVALDMDPMQLRPSSPDSMVVRRADQLFATATFQPGRWFDTVNQADLDEAYLINFRGRTVLFVHKDFNTSIYQKIIGNVHPTTQLEFRIENGS